MAQVARPQARRVAADTRLATGAGRRRHIPSDPVDARKDSDKGDALSDTSAPPGADTDSDAESTRGERKGPNVKRFLIDVSSCSGGNWCTVASCKDDVNDFDSDSETHRASSPIAHGGTNTEGRQERREARRRIRTKTPPCGFPVRPERRDYLKIEDRKKHLIRYWNKKYAQLPSQDEHERDRRLAFAQADRRRRGVACWAADSFTDPRALGPKWCEFCGNDIWMDQFICGRCLSSYGWCCAITCLQCQQPSCPEVHCRCFNCVP